MQLFNGDCLEIMKSIPDKSVDMVLCDLPYGTTEFKWDSVIDFNILWQEYKRIIKDFSAIVLFGQEPFSSHLRFSNFDWYKYEWFWEKTRCGNILNSKNAPLKKIENIIVFSNGTIANCSPKRMKYNPQGLKVLGKKVKNKQKSIYHFGRETKGAEIRKNDFFIQEYTNYPCNILKFNSVSKPKHPTEKPIELLEYLIKTYTNENEVVLDNCMGSGSTGVAAVKNHRDFIGIELDTKYFEIAKERINEAAMLNSIAYKSTVGR